jgi:hypothetical protein
LNVKNTLLSLLSSSFFPPSSPPTDGFAVANFLLHPFFTFCYFPCFHAVPGRISIRRKSAASPIVHQPAAQFYDCFVEGIKQRIRTEKLLSASP